MKLKLVGFLTLLLAVGFPGGVQSDDDDYSAAAVEEHACTNAPTTGTGLFTNILLRLIAILLDLLGGSTPPINANVTTTWYVPMAHKHYYRHMYEFVNNGAPATSQSQLNDAKIKWFFVFAATGASERWEIYGKTTLDTCVIVPFEGRNITHCTMIYLFYTKVSDYDILYYDADSFLLERCSDGILDWAYTTKANPALTSEQNTTIYNKITESTSPEWNWSNAEYQVHS